MAIIRRMAYSLAKPRGAVDRASPDGRTPLPLEAPFRLKYYAKN